MFKFLLNLQTFADGGGDGASAGEGGEANIAGEELPNRIPERARKMYEKTVARKASVKEDTSSQMPSDDKVEEDSKPQHLSYADLIKSDEYKEEHKAYMDKTIGDRLKKYKGVEAENQTMRNALGIVANKYGLDSTADDFLSTLEKKLSEDSSYYEDYAMEHNISTEDAKEILTLRHQARVAEAEKARVAEEAKQNEFINMLRAKAEQTKAIYPDFNLELELQNPKFQQLLSATNGDTTSAYRVTHYDDLVRQQGLQARQTATQQVSNAVVANRQRPIENGLSSTASTIVQTDWRKANIQQIRQFAEEQRRLKR